jgi:hypothetical protein
MYVISKVMLHFIIIFPHMEHTKNIYLKDDTTKCIQTEDVWISLPIIPHLPHISPSLLHSVMIFTNRLITMNP